MDLRIRRTSSATARGAQEHGMVTAEFAVGLIGLVFALLSGAWAIAIVVTQVRCIDAARDTARALARGESRDAAIGEGRRSAPTGAAISLASNEGRADVRVSVDARPPWPILSGLTSIRVVGNASVRYEPDAGNMTGELTAAQIEELRDLRRCRTSRQARPQDLCGTTSRRRLDLKHRWVLASAPAPASAGVGRRLAARAGAGR